MKKIIIVVPIILICILCIILDIIFDPNVKLMVNEILAMFKPTVYLHYQVDIDEVKEVDIGGVVNRRYREKSTIKEMVNHLNHIPLAKVSRDELASMSPDVMILFRNNNENIIGRIWIYGDVFIEDPDSGKIYRSKTERILEELFGI